MGKKRILVCLVALALLVLLPLPANAESAGSRYFSVTGHNVQGEFLKFFDAHGGLDVFGYPRTEQFVENGRLVQYFQRQRMEFWPENPQPYNVQLMLIGSVVLGPGDPPTPSDVMPSASDSTSRYYSETGHTLSGDFKDYFDNHGGIDVFGYPVTEPKNQGGLLVQYFQRARFEKWESGLITLGLLGDEYIFRMGGIPLALTGPQSPLTMSAAQPPSDTAGPGYSGVATTSTTSTSGKIVFQKSIGGVIYSVNVDGTGLTQIGAGIEPSLSPDGQKVAYALWGYPQGIHVLDLNSGQAGLLFSVHEARSPVWSPDGGRIAYYVKTPGYRMGRFGRVEPDDFFNIVVLDLATMKTSNPPSQPQHSFSPSWSPDGNRLVFKGDSGLYISDNGSTSKIPYTDERFASPVWSRDGQTIAFMYRQHDHWEVGSINFDGSNFRLLTSSPPFTSPANNVAPTWSADGSKIAFVSDRDGTWKIYTMNADGSDQHKLTDEIVDYQWSMERVISWSDK